MGVGSSLECCTRRGDSNITVCDLNDSIFGEDAFYRDAFYDCQEGNQSHDHLFALAQEQARLKYRKGTLFAKYASFELQRRAGAASEELATCMADPRQHHHGGTREVRSCRSQISGSPAGSGVTQNWLGRTMEEWRAEELPETGGGPFWAVGDGLGLKVRAGPNYVKSGRKVESKGALYQALSCDAIKADSKITDIIGRLVKELPPPPESFGESDRSGGAALEWTPDCPLPRVVCLNLMLPYETGLLPFSKDGGCSFVGFFHVKSETLKALRSQEMPPAVRLFKEFCAGPCGKPGGPANDPDRSLAARADKTKKKDRQTGLFKAIAHCLNPSDVNVPDMFHAYNGKPCIITKSGYVIKDPCGEWIELGIDVRGFNVMARKMLCSFRSLLPQTKIHYGFLIQGVEDEDMPEGLLCDMYVYGVNMLDDPLNIQDQLPNA